MDGKKATKQLSSTTTPPTTTYKQFSQLNSKLPYPIPPPLSLRSRSRLQTVSSTKTPTPKTARPTTNTSKNVSKLDSNPKRPTSASAFPTTLPPYAQSRLKKQQQQESHTPKTSRGTTSKQMTSLMSPRSLVSSRCSSNMSASINSKNSNNNNNSTKTKLVNTCNLKSPEKSRLSKSCTSARSNFSSNNNSILSGMSKEFKNSQLGADIQLFMSHPLFSTIMAENPELQNITTAATTATTTKKTPVNGSNKTSQLHENSRKSSIGKKGESNNNNNNNCDTNDINDYQDLTDEKIHQEIETMLEKLHLEAMKEQDKMSYQDDDNNNNSLVLTNNAKNSISEATLEPAVSSNQAKKLKSESNLKKRIPIHNFEATGSSSSTSSVHRNKSKMTVTKMPVLMTPSFVGHSHRERDKIEIPDEIKHLMNDDFDEEALRQKMVLLKNRYQHIVKTELHNLMTGDDDLLPENSTSPEFVKTLMGLVKKDKEIANIAVDLVQEIDLLETAELSYSSKKALMGGDGDEEVAIFQELWQNHKACRTQITRNLEKERDELFKDKYISETKRPNEQKNNNNNKTSSKSDHSENNNDTTHSENMEIDTTEKQDHVDEKNPNLLKLQSEVTKDLQQVFFTDFFEKSMEKMKKQAKKVRESNSTINVENNLENNSTDVDKDLEIKRGLGKLLRRLDCDSSAVINHHNNSSSMNDVLLLIQDKMQTLRDNIQDLKKVSNKQNL